MPVLKYTNFKSVFPLTSHMSYNSTHLSCLQSQNFGAQTSDIVLVSLQLVLVLLFVKLRQLLVLLEGLLRIVSPCIPRLQRESHTVPLDLNKHFVQTLQLISFLELFVGIAAKLLKRLLF